MDKDFLPLYCLPEPISIVNFLLYLKKDMIETFYVVWSAGNLDEAADCYIL